MFRNNILQSHITEVTATVEPFLAFKNSTTIIFMTAKN